MRSVFDSKSVNSDAVGQRILKQLLITVAEGHKNDRDLSSFFRQRDWSTLETGRCVVHALLKIKVQRADLYARAREIGEPIYMAR